MEGLFHCSISEGLLTAANLDHNMLDLDYFLSSFC